MEDTTPQSDLLLELNSLREEINNLKNNIDQSYYSIPKNEFETITVNKITHEVMERMQKIISSWRNWTAIFILILSFFGITQGDKLIRPIIEDKVEESTTRFEKIMDERIQNLNARVEDTLQELKQTKRDLSNDIHNELNRISRNIDEQASRAANIAAKLETERQLATVRNDIQTAQKTVLKTELNTLVNDVKGFKLTEKEALAKLNPLLQRAIRLNDKELANEFLDSLFRWTFLIGSYEDLDKQRVRYEKDFEFKETTWANIAIGDMHLYNESYSPIYKERALSAIEHALIQTPDYGLPVAVRLIIHMIDHVKLPDPADREQELDAALKLINQVNSGSRMITSQETYDYLTRITQKSKVYSFVQMLFDNFPQEMDTMRKRYENHLILSDLLKTLPKDEALKKWEEFNISGDGTQ